MINQTEYENKGFNEWQIANMRQADKNGVSKQQIQAWLEDKRYNQFQHNEIMLGLISGIDVSIYASLGLSAEEMKQARDKLEKQKLELEGIKNAPVQNIEEIAKLEKYEKSYQQHQNMYLSLFNACMCLAILALVISFLTIIVIVLLLK